jgi:peptidoglycan/xylan/chitin deacetylase (PgdA/CDA1 family)
MINMLTIVMYHYIRPIKNSKFFNINGLEVEEFINQIEYIKKHYNVITINDYIEAERSGDSLSNNSLILSFDDGYADHYDFVLPVLKKFKIKGIFFPVGKPCMERSILDVNKIHFILNATKNYVAIIDSIEKKIPSMALKDKNIEYFRSNFYKKNRFDIAEVNYIKRLLQVGLPYNYRTELVKKLFSQYVTVDEKDFSNNLYLSIEQLREMKSYGMEIGSHGYEHFWLNSLDNQKQDKDIQKSLIFLNSINAKNDKFIFCYPYGGYNKNTLKILNNNNCDAAFTCEVGLVNSETNNMLELPRLDTNDFPKTANANITKWTKQLLNEN